MKKLYMFLSGAAFLACALCITPSAVSAQTNVSGVAPQKHGGTVSAAVMEKVKNKLNPPHVPNTNSTSQLLLQYWFAMDSMGVDAGSTPLNFYDYLFPDSTVQTGTGANAGYVFTHLAGSVLDPNGLWLQQYNSTPYSWSNANGYTIDSLAIAYTYDRTTDPSIVDTLVVYLWDNAVSTDINRNYYFPPASGVPADYNVDTIFLALIPYDSINLSKNIPKTSPGALHTFKVPLTASDTATTGANAGVKVATTNFSVPAGKIVGCAYGFIPGYSYVFGDNITSTANDFTFLSSEPNGDPNGDGTGSYGFYEKGDWNMCSIANSQVRYDQSPGNWDGFLIPSYAFDLGYSLQQHLVSYYVTGDFNVGLNEPTAAGGLKLFQNQPNPANHTTMLRYETQSAGPVTFEVRDLTGRLIMEFNEGTQSAGVHSTVVDVSNISKGVYLYTLKSDKESITNRMVIE